MKTKILLAIGLLASLFPASLSAQAVATRPQPANISARGKDVVAGFVIRGPEPKEILVRALGPGLADFAKVPNTMPDPTLTVYNDKGVVVAKNEGWSIDLKDEMARVGAFAIAANSKDAAAVVSLAPGAYTVVSSASPNDPRNGIVLVEVYDLSAFKRQNLASEIVNMSVLVTAEAGDQAIGGMILSGIGARTILIRSIGIEIGKQPFNVGGTMRDPSLTVFDTDTKNKILGFNNGWSLTATGQTTVTGTTFAQVGAFPLTPGTADSAVLVSVPVNSPSGCTAVAKGTGRVLIEFYMVP